MSYDHLPKSRRPRLEPMELQKPEPTFLGGLLPVTLWVLLASVALYGAIFAWKAVS